MPKIRKSFYRNEGAKLKIDYHLEYSTPTRWEGRKPFFVRIPERYQDLAREDSARGLVQTWNSRGQYYTAATGDSEEEAEENFEKYMDLYLASNSQEEDVILYQFKYKSRNFTSDPDEDRSQKVSMRNFHFRSDGKVELEFDFHVCVKKTFGPKVTYYRKEEELKNVIANEVATETGGYNQWVEVPYTPEAEAFFTDLYIAMEKLCDKFTTFIGSKHRMLDTLKDKMKLLS